MTRELHGNTGRVPKRVLDQAALTAVILVNKQNQISVAYNRNATLTFLTTGLQVHWGGLASGCGAGSGQLHGMPLILGLGLFMAGDRRSGNQDKLCRHV